MMNELYLSWKKQFDSSRPLVAPADLTKGNDCFHSIKDAPCWWIGVRGSQYFLEELVAIGPSRAYGRLVPEPENEFDPLAVAIYIQNKKIGYITSRMARSFFAPLSFLAEHGHPLAVLVEISVSSYLLGPDDPDFDEWVDQERQGWEVYACIPTLHRLDTLIPEQVLFSVLQPLWDGIPEDLRNQIIADRFHLTEETGSQLLQYQHLAPNYLFPHRFDEEMQDQSMNRFLQHVRLEHRAAEAKKKEQRNLQIAKLDEIGIARKEVAELYDLKPSTIGNIVRAFHRSNASN